MFLVRYLEWLLIEWLIEIQDERVVLLDAPCLNYAW